MPYLPSSACRGSNHKDDIIELNPEGPQTRRGNGTRRRSHPTSVFDRQEALSAEDLAAVRMGIRQKACLPGVIGGRFSRRRSGLLLVASQERIASG
jgi:hypothetical protein